MLNMGSHLLLFNFLINLSWLIIAQEWQHCCNTCTVSFTTYCFIIICACCLDKFLLQFLDDYPTLPPLHSISHFPKQENEMSTNFI